VIENEEERKRKKKATSKEYRFLFGLVWLGVNRRVVMVDMI